MSVDIHVRVRNYTHFTRTSLTPHYIWRRITKSAKLRSDKFEMPRKPNEIAVEWLESRDVGRRHRVNVKHIIGKLQEVKVGQEVVVKLNSRRYRATVIDLLDWVPPKRKQKVAKSKVPKQKCSTKVCLCVVYFQQQSYS